MKGCFKRKSTTLSALAAEFSIPLTHQELMDLANRAWADRSPNEKDPIPRRVKVNGRDTYVLKHDDIVRFCLFAHSRDNDLPKHDARYTRFRAAQREMFKAVMDYITQLGGDVLDLGGSLPDTGGDLFMGLMNSTILSGYQKRHANKTVH